MTITEARLWDELRDLRGLGFNALRIGNGDVMEHIDSVIFDVLRALGAEVRND
ncbi:MAG: hypothetical protein AB7E81_15375 [Hyphomicrobiaceae bacterium]